MTEGTLERMGTLVRVEGETYVVRVEESAPGDPGPFAEVRAARAVSCLVEPEQDDLVLLVERKSGGASRAAFVLAVLERESPHTAIAARGDLELRLRDGRFRVAAQRGVDVVTPESVAVVSNQFAVHANTVKVVATELVALASQAVAEIARTKLSGSIFDKVFERVSERVERSVRRVTELEQLTAKQIDYVAEQNLSIKSDTAVLTASDLVRLDSRRALDAPPTEPATEAAAEPAAPDADPPTDP